jgi:prepilin-type N-terminal cleavage/methylation domain-containing protein
MNKTEKQSHGFTLIELLVVIGIIGILTTLITSNLTIAQGLEMYYSQNNQYPDIGSGSGGTFSFNSGVLTDPVVTTDVYIKSIPKDPRNSNTSGNVYQYYYCTEQVTAPTRRRRFNLYARLENANDVDKYCNVAGATAWSGVSCDAASTTRCNIGSADTSGTSTPHGTVQTNSNFTVSDP